MNIFEITATLMVLTALFSYVNYQSIERVVAESQTKNARSEAMKTIFGTCKLAYFYFIIALAGMLLVSGCARYARTVNTLYEPAASIQGGRGNAYLVIPENQQTQSPEIKWVIGKVKDGD